MPHLEPVTLVVRDYDAAIRFFIDTLQFELIENMPSLTNNAVRSVGSSFGLKAARPAFCSHVPTASISGRRRPSVR